jgi:hypothetical protein
MPGSPQRHRVRRGGRRDRSPPPAPPAGAGLHQRPTRPPAGLDRDACCRSSCHVQGGHAAESFDCPQERRAESRKRLQRFQPPAGFTLNRRLIQRGDCRISRDRR